MFTDDLIDFMRNVEEPTSAQIEYLYFCYAYHLRSYDPKIARANLLADFAARIEYNRSNADYCRQKAVCPIVAARQEIQDSIKLLRKASSVLDDLDVAYVISDKVESLQDEAKCSQEQRAAWEAQRWMDSAERYETGMAAAQQLFDENRAKFDDLVARAQNLPYTPEYTD